VGRKSDDPAAAHDAARGFGRQIRLTEMHPCGAAYEREVAAVVDDQAYAPCGGKFHAAQQVGRQLPVGRDLVAYLNPACAPARQFPEDREVRRLAGKRFVGDGIDRGQADIHQFCFWK